jgi:nucleoid DNA-binding protein
MNKAQIINLIDQYFKDHGIKVPKYHCEEVFIEICRVFTQVVAVGGTVHIPEIGQFTGVTTKPRTARNPHTEEVVQVPAKRKVKYKMSKRLKDLLN